MIVSVQLSEAAWALLGLDDEYRRANIGVRAAPRRRVEGEPDRMVLLAEMYEDVLAGGYDLDHPASAMRCARTAATKIRAAVAAKKEPT